MNELNHGDGCHQKSTTDARSTYRRRSMSCFSSPSSIVEQPSIRKSKLSFLPSSGSSVNIEALDIFGLCRFRRRRRRRRPTSRSSYQSQDGPHDDSNHDRDDHQQSEPEPDDELYRLLNLKPWVPTERDRYDDRAVQRRIQECPQSVCARYGFKGPTTSGRRFPFFRAVCLGASLEVLQEMHRICPYAIQHTCPPPANSTPLHGACAYQASLEVIQFLLAKYPQAAKLKTSSGYTPLHNACEYGVSSIDVIPMLINAYPEALTIRNKLGKTPYETVLFEKQQKQHRQQQQQMMLTTSNTPDISSSIDDHHHATKTPPDMALVVDLDLVLNELKQHETEKI